MNDTTTLSPTVHKLLLAVRAEPDNWNLRRILADAYEDAGEDMLANGQRWQASRKRFSTPNTLRGFEQHPWDWHCASAWVNEHPHCFVPEDILQAMEIYRPSSRRINRRFWRHYPTQDAAEHALAVALWSLGIVVRGDEI